MGQYYRGAILSKTSNTNKRIKVVKAFCPYAHKNGAKLMEHSYVGNNYVKAYEVALAGEFYGQPFVWAGDYADTFTINDKEHDVYVLASRLILKEATARAKEQGYRINPEKNTLFRDFRSKTKENGEYTYRKMEDFVDVLTYEDSIPIKHRYIINFTKKMYTVIPEKDRSSEHLTVHPLPLLCAFGNGRGGGDYSGKNMELIGAWAFDRIGVANELPEGFKTELVVSFEENYYNPTQTRYSPTFKDYEIVVHE